MGAFGEVDDVDVGWEVMKRPPNAQRVSWLHTNFGHLARPMHWEGRDAVCRTLLLYPIPPMTLLSTAMAPVRSFGAVRETAHKGTSARIMKALTSYSLSITPRHLPCALAMIFEGDSRRDDGSLFLHMRSHILCSQIKHKSRAQLYSCKGSVPPGLCNAVGKPQPG